MSFCIRTRLKPPPSAERKDQHHHGDRTPKCKDNGVHFITRGGRPLRGRPGTHEGPRTNDRGPGIGPVSADVRRPARRRRSRGRPRLRGRGRRGLRRHPLRGLAQGPVDLELGDVIVVDRRRVILIRHVQGLDRLHHFLGPDHQAQQLTRGPRRLAQADEVLVGRLDGLAQALLVLDHPRPRRLQPGGRLRDLGLDAVDDPGQLDRRHLLLGPALADQADVAHPAVPQLPDRGDLDVEPGTVLTQVLVQAGRQTARRQQPRGRRRARDDQVRQQRPRLLLAEKLLRRRHQLAPGGDLGTIIERDRHQLRRRLLARYERHLQERRLDRLEQRGRLEQQHLGQLGARHPPVADVELPGLQQTLELGPGPVDLQRGDQARRQPLGEVHQQLGPRDRRPDPQQLPPRRLQAEEGLGDRQQGIVPRRLQVGLPRRDHAAGRQRAVDGVGKPDEQRRPAADKGSLPRVLEQPPVKKFWITPSCR